MVSIGGPLPAEASASLTTKNKTPVLVCSGVDSSWITSSAEEKLKNNFEHVQVSRYRRRGDTMPQNRDEMMPVMQFFARRLRQPAPTGTVELAWSSNNRRREKNDAVYHGLDCLNVDT